MTENLIIFNARVVTPVGFSARRGREMEELCIIDDATVEVTGGVITYVGPNRGEERDGYYQRYWHYNARGKCLLPGFVDSHTHFVFGGERAEEFSWRLKGESYMSIMERGGGIVSTVKATRECNFIQLRAKAEGFLKQMSTMGVTTVEGKSGYGLDKETELLQLRVMRSLNNDEHKRVDIVPTFLGAHAVPQEYDGRTDDYVDFIIREVMPAVVQNRLAEFCDVFCEQGVFSIGQSRRLLTAAREMGLALKLHADEIVPLGGAGLAAELSAVSADHLLHASDADIRAMADKGVVATLLPLTAFALKEPYARGREMIDAGCAVALATDLNPRQLFLRFYPADLCAGMYLYEDEYRRSHNRPHAERSSRLEPGRQHRQYRGGKERRLCGAEHGQLPFPALLRGDELCTHHGEGRCALSGALKQKTNTLYFIFNT